jgi:hypothetical protein
MKNVVRITYTNGECYEASVAGCDNISYTEKAFEEMVKNCAKLIEVSFKHDEEK